MKRTNTRRLIIVVALLGLAALLVIQVYWFLNAYKIQERQFDEKVVLALRRVTSQMLLQKKDSTSRISSVEQTSRNSFHADFNNDIRYALLDSLIKNEFLESELYSPFELVVYDDRSNGVLFGNYYKNGAFSEGEATCLGRVSPPWMAMDFTVTFPHKKADIAGALGIWIFSAATFLLILILFGFMILDLSKQKKLSELKADFINNMTHELQTPITNISIASEVLRKSRGKIDEEKAVHYAEIIYAENQRLKFQVEKVLQTAIWEKGEIELAKKEVDIHSLINEVVDNFRLRVQSRHGQINSKLNALRPLIQGDYFHLTNIVYSLLDNADKYSRSTPDITITTTNHDRGVVIAIEDKGIGMRQEVQRFIFDKFYRASDGGMQDVTGFGLGLTYVQKIVNAHEGRVSVSSTPGEGSLFELFFRNC